MQIRSGYYLSLLWGLQEARTTNYVVRDMIVCVILLYFDRVMHWGIGYTELLDFRVTCKRQTVFPKPSRFPQVALLYSLSFDPFIATWVNRQVTEKKPFDTLVIVCCYIRPYRPLRIAINCPFWVESLQY